VQNNSNNNRIQASLCQLRKAILKNSSRLELGWMNRMLWDELGYFGFGNWDNENLFHKHLFAVLKTASEIHVALQIYGTRVVLGVILINFTKWWVLWEIVEVKYFTAWWSDQEIVKDDFHLMVSSVGNKVNNIQTLLLTTLQNLSTHVYRKGLLELKDHHISYMNTICIFNLKNTEFLHMHRTELNCKNPKDMSILKSWAKVARHCQR